MTPLPPHQPSLGDEQGRAGSAPVSECPSHGVKVPLVPATEAEVIAALGRAFAFACRKAEGRG